MQGAQQVFKASERHRMAETYPDCLTLTGCEHVLTSATLTGHAMYVQHAITRKRPFRGIDSRAALARPVPIVVKRFTRSSKCP